MANGNISDVPASTYAEYVSPPIPASPEPSDGLNGGASDSASDEEPVAAAQAIAPASGSPQSPGEVLRGCPAVRPALAHRLYSHRLHVRAKAKLQRDRLLSGPMINIYVGEPRRHWALHRNLLYHHSELLESELEGDGKKKVDKLELPDHDPAGFELLVKWLYQGKLDDVSDIVDPNSKYDYAVSCHKLYLLCERFDMPQLKNVAMDQYRRGLSQAELVPDAEEINDIYRQSPTDSPFRRLMTKIAARQIMDPASERDVETYRDCFVDNPDFAVDLVNAIKLGTGGMLFDDPTDTGNECDYHDHEAGPNCHIKGKGKVKQALKAPARPHDLKSSKSAPSEKPDPHPHLLRPLHQTPDPPPPARQARLHDGVSAGPLRRRLTSPASSTVETTPENATASPPSPQEQRDKFRLITPPRQPPSPTAIESSHPAQDARPQSLDGESRQLPASSSTNDGSEGNESNKKGSNDREGAEALTEDASPRRGIWEWARVGPGRFGIIGRIPHPEWKGSSQSKAANSDVVNGAPKDGKAHDDFSIPSTTATEPDSETQRDEVAAAKLEGLGISTSTIDPILFSQTKNSSDDLVASVNGTPSPQALRRDGSSEVSDDSAPATPSPPARKQREQPADDALIPRGREQNGDTSSTTSRTSQKNDINGKPEATPSPHRIPKYKIALASNLLSPAKTPVS